MATWKKSSIKNICILGRGRVISQSEIFKNLGIYPVYSSQSKNNGEMGRIKTYDFEGEYVTWTTDGAYAGTVFYRNGRFNCTNVCGTLLGRGGVNMRYLAYSFGSIAKKHVSYVGNPKLMNNIVADIEISIPEDITEQEKIAEILAKIDKAILLTESSISKQERVKKGLMQDLLTKGIDENGNIRSEGTHKFKDSELGRIPEEWDIVDLEKITINQKSSIKIGPFGSQLKREYFVSKGYKVYGQENAFTSDFSIGDRKINQDRFNFLKTCELKSGDIIISMMGTIGKCCIVPDGIEQGIIDSHLIRIRVDEKKYLKPLFKYIITDYAPIFRQIKNLSVGSIMEGLSSRIIRQLVFPYPKDRSEQEMIVEILSNQDTLIQKERNTLSKLQRIKSGLMQDLLTGKVRVDNLLLQ